MTQYCVLSSQITNVGYVGNVICLKFAQESFKVLFESAKSCYEHSPCKRFELFFQSLMHL